MPLSSVNYCTVSQCGRTPRAKISLNYSQCRTSPRALLQELTRKFDHLTPALRDLRWLPIKQNLFFRDAVMAFKCMTGKAPRYLSDQFTTRIAVTGHTKEFQPVKHDFPLFSMSQWRMPRFFAIQYGGFCTV